MTSAVPTTNPDRALIEALYGLFDEDSVDVTDAQRELFGQDVFTIGQPVAVVVRPKSAVEVAGLVHVARRFGWSLAPRGGGMSYTGGYLSSQPERTIAVDMTAMGRVIAVNNRDMFAVVEAGCTWQALHEALRPLGLRTPYWGPVSGRLATVGGSVSQNAAFWGSGKAGTAADSVLGIELITGTGEILRTGSFGVADASPFFRHFGPDLTGIFTSDCGRFGIKTRIALRLETLPFESSDAFLARSPEKLFAFLAALGQRKLVAQTMALDARLQSERVAATSAKERAGHAAALLKRPGSVGAGLRDAVGMVRAGLAPAAVSGFVVHTFVEGLTDDECSARAASVARLAGELGLEPTNAAIGGAMLRSPFGPVTGLAGTKGERWVPVHCIVPHSRAEELFLAIGQILTSNNARLETHGIKVRNLFCSVGVGAIVIEPMFLWQGALNSLVLHTLASQGGNVPAHQQATPEAEAVVLDLRRQIIIAGDRLGAVHMQIGRTYPYADRLAPTAAGLLEALRQELDPDSVFNDALALRPAAA